MKYVLSLVITATFLFSCEHLPQPTRASAANEKIVRQYFEHFNQHDWRKMASLYSETADFKDPSLGRGIVQQTRQQIIQKYAELSQTFPDIQDEIVCIYPSGEKQVIVEFISTGTAPDHSSFALPICTIFTLEKGKIIKDFTYYDNAAE